MIWEIAKKEMMHHLLSFRFTAAAVLCVLVILTSCVAMYRQYEGRAQDYALNVARVGEARASIPPTLMSVFAWGVEDVTGKTVEFNELPALQGLPIRAPLNLFDTFFPTFDLSYVVRIIGALLAMGFAFDAICGEGRSGTLALMLAAGASRRGVLLGKLAGGFPVILVLFFGPMLFGLAILTILFSAPLTLDMLTRMVLWGMGSAFYLFCFFCLGLLISTAITTPKVSLMVCLVLWTLLIFVVPSAVTSLNLAGTHLLSPARLERLNFYATMRDKLRFDEEVQRQVQKRGAWANEMLGFANRTLVTLRTLPSAAYLDMSTNLAGTGLPEVARYYDAIRRYMGDVRDAQKSRSAVPAFTFVRSSLGICVQSSITDILSLVLWSVVAFWFAVVTFSRYDVRVKEAGQI